VAPRGGELRAALDWFAGHRVLTILLCWIYFFWVAAAHDLVQQIAYALREDIGKERWAALVAGVCVLGAAVLCWRVVPALRRSEVRGPATWAWWGSIALMVACFFTLFATNIEAIHFIQYAVLAVPLFALTRRVGVTVLLVGILGALDEWHQYSFIFENWRIRWDVNDVVMNVLGGLSGVAAIVAFGRPGRVTAGNPGLGAAAIWGPLALTTVVVAAGSAVMLGTGDMDLYREEGERHAFIQLSREAAPTERWEDPYWGRRHYVLHPGVGIAICLLLTAAFTGLDHVVAFRGLTNRPEKDGLPDE
jgi:hypothetical protein